MTDKVKEFFESIKADDIFGLTTMINEDGTLVDAVNENGIPALMFSLYYGRKEVAILLKKSGAKLDVFLASALGDTAKLGRILDADRGAVAKRSVDGWTPLHLAAFFRQKEAAEMLLAAGADVTALSDNQMKNHPLHAAAAGGSRDMVALLLERGSPVNAIQHGGWTALHNAAQSGDVEMVKMLLANGANADVRAENGQSPLDLAMGKGSQAIVDLLMHAPRIQ